MSTLQAFAEYGLRFDIEENFLDDQSVEWNVQRSMIRNVCALSRLKLSQSNGLSCSKGMFIVQTGRKTNGYCPR